MAKAISDSLQTCIKGIMKSEGVESYELNKLGNTLKGDNYSGEITFVHVKTDGSNQNYDLVIKCDSKSEELRKQFSAINIYLRENLVYGRIFPAFEQFQLENSVEKPFKKYAKYYDICDEQKEYLLVLENLKVKGFELHDRKVSMNLEHIQYVLIQYARLHAVSMAMKRLEPELFRSLTKDVDDIMQKSIDQSNMVPMFIKYMARALKLLNINDAKKFEGYELDIENIFTKTTYDPEDPVAVILHGDCWNNNFMFKYDQNNKTRPIDVRFLDFQISRVAHPILDLSYFLYACCDKEILENFDSLLKLYHSTLSDSLSQYGVDVNTFFPLTKLRGDWRKFSIFGLNMALLVIQIALCDSSEALDLKEVVENNQDIADSFLTIMKEDERYNERVRAILEHFCETFL